VTNPPGGGVSSTQMRLALLAVLTVMAAGCGSAPSAELEAGRPPGKLQQSNGPPRAWLETSDGNRWLAGGSSCWHFEDHNVCGDAGAPTCGQPLIPHFRVARGERVLAHLGFTPAEASLSGEMGVAEPAQLRGRTLEWRVSKGGVFTVFAKGERGDASYSGCADLTS
jgi:hypothetical protein